MVDTFLVIIIYDQFLDPFSSIMPVCKFVIYNSFSFFIAVSLQFKMVCD